MAGSNAVAVPVALIALLEGEFESDSDVLVTFSENARDTSREHIFGGRVSGPQQPFAMRGGAARGPREENLNWELRGWISQPGKTAVENAQRAMAIGGRIEDVFASAAVLVGAGVPGCKLINIVGFAMEHMGTDDEPITEIVYTVAFKSVLN